jgi:signal transduction histidine kinase
VRRPQLRSLSARIVALTLFALVLGQAVSFTLFVVERNRMLDSVLAHDARAWISATVRVLQEVPPEGRGAVLHATSGQLQWFRLHNDPQIPAGGPPAMTAELVQALGETLGDEWARGLRTHVGTLNSPPEGWPYPDWPQVTVALQLPDGRWLHFGRLLLDPRPYWARTALLTVLIAGVLMTVLVVLVARRIARPLARLSDAADRLGRGETVAPLTEEGPADVRRTTRAFNDMRARLERFVQDRTRMIAAIAHDLRTPITALRLRLEFLPDDENRRRMEASLDDMAQMTESSLAFARDDAALETSRNVDLAALLDVIAEEYRARGHEVHFESDRRVPLVCRPGALKRALGNLVDNAVTYGGSARISLSCDGDTALIEVIDSGPGIPASELEHVFAPFVRLETSRNAGTGGTGLGLSIARTIIHSHGGQIRLRNRDRGLAAQVTLPLQAYPEAG